MQNYLERNLKTCKKKKFPKYLRKKFKNMRKTKNLSMSTEIQLDKIMETIVVIFKID